MKNLLALLCVAAGVLALAGCEPHCEAIGRDCEVDPFAFRDAVDTVHDEAQCMYFKSILDIIQSLGFVDSCDIEFHEY